MTSNSFLQFARRDIGYEREVIDSCEKFAREDGGIEFFIKCDADTKTFQRCYTEHKD